MDNIEKYRALSLVKNEHNATVGAIVQWQDPELRVEFLQKEEIQLLIAQGRFNNLKAKLRLSPIQQIVFTEIMPDSDVKTHTMSQAEINSLMHRTLMEVDAGTYSKYMMLAQMRKNSDQRAQNTSAAQNQRQESYTGSKQNQVMSRKTNVETQQAKAVNSKEQIIKAFEHDIKMVINEKLPLALRDKNQHLRDMKITRVDRNVGGDVIQQVSFEVTDVADRTGGYFGGYVDLHCTGNKYTAQFVMFADYTEDEANEGTPFTEFDTPYGLDVTSRYTLAKEMMYQITSSEGRLADYYKNY